MNREILFRGKRKDNNEWVYGSLITNVNQTERYFIIENETIAYKNNDEIIKKVIENYIEVIPKTIGQYTGLKDKNGKKIFEGDMLKSYYDKPGIVKWNNEIGAFQIKGIPSQTMKRCYEMEVIGNIYESKINE